MHVSPKGPTRRRRQPGSVRRMKQALQSAMARESVGERMAERQISKENQQQCQTCGSALLFPPDDGNWAAVQRTTSEEPSTEPPLHGLPESNREFFTKYGFLKYPIGKKFHRPSGSGSSKLGLNSISDTVSVKCAVNKRRGKQFGRWRDQLTKRPKAHEEGRQQRL